MTAVERRRAERGMTLVEALVAVFLTGMITAALGGALIVTLGPDQQAANRLASAHDAQLVALYLPDDVQSATAVDLAGSSTPPCSGTEPGTNALQLSWTQAVPSSTTYNVSYRVQTVGDERQLIRFACQGTAVAEQTVVAHGLDADLPGDPAVTVTSSGRRITVRLRTTDGVVATISGLRRTPPTVCTVTSQALSTSTVSATAGVLAEPVTMTVTTQGPCTGLTLHFTRTSPESVNFSGSTATLPSTGWTTYGTYTLQVRDASTGTTALAEEALVVEAPPCEATLSPVPNPVAMGSGTALASNVVVAVSTTGTCTDPLELAYTTPGDNIERVVAISAGSATIPGATGQWAPGDVDLVARATTDGRVAGAATLTVTAFVPCTVSVSPSPNPVGMTGSDLSQTVSVTVTAPSTCGALELVYKRRPSDATSQVRALGSGPYTTTIPVAGPWQAGNVLLEVRQVGTTTVLGSTQLVVGCTVTSMTLTPNTFDGDAPASVDVDVTTTGACTGIRLQYTPKVQVRTPALVETSAGVWTYTIVPGNGQDQWNDGTHVISVIQATTTDVLSSTNLVVTP